MESVNLQLPVSYIHIRQFRRLNNDEIARFKEKHPGVKSPEMTVVSNGGATIGYIRDGNKVMYSMAFCNPKDTFCRRVGRAITRGRLLKNKDVDILEIPANAYRGVVHDALKEVYYDIFDEMYPEE